MDQMNKYQTGQGQALTCRGNSTWLRVRQMFIGSLDSTDSTQVPRDFNFIKSPNTNEIFPEIIYP